MENFTSEVANWLSEQPIMYRKLHPQVVLGDVKGFCFQHSRPKGNSATLEMYSALFRQCTRKQNEPVDNCVLL